MGKITITFNVSDKLKKDSRTEKEEDYKYEYVMAWLKGEKVKNLKMVKE